MLFSAEVVAIILNYVAPGTPREILPTAIALRTASKHYQSVLPVRYVSYIAGVDFGRSKHRAVMYHNSTISITYLANAAARVEIDRFYDRSEYRHLLAVTKIRGGNVGELLSRSPEMWFDYYAMIRLFKEATVALLCDMATNVKPRFDCADIIYDYLTGGGRCEYARPGWYYNHTSRVINVHNMVQQRPGAIPTVGRISRGDGNHRAAVYAFIDNDEAAHRASVYYDISRHVDFWNRRFISMYPVLLNDSEYISNCDDIDIATCTIAERKFVVRNVDYDKPVYKGASRVEFRRALACGNASRIKELSMVGKHRRGSTRAEKKNKLRIPRPQRVDLPRGKFKSSYR